MCDPATLTASYVGWVVIAATLAAGVASWLEVLV